MVSARLPAGRDAAARPMLPLHRTIAARAGPLGPRTRTAPSPIGLRAVGLPTGLLMGLLMGLLTGLLGVLQGGDGCNSSASSPKNLEAFGEMAERRRVMVPSRWMVAGIMILSLPSSISAPSSSS